MLNLPIYEKYNGEKHIALLDNSTVAFMHQLDRKGHTPEILLKDYDVVFIPQWVMKEIEDSEFRSRYVEKLVNEGISVQAIAEVSYGELMDGEEISLYHIVHATVSRIGQFMKYMRQNVAKTDLLDLDPYDEWIQKMYVNWPMPGEITADGRQKKKNAGEISLTILAEIFSWHYPALETLTVYTQDADSYDFQKHAEIQLQRIFTDKVPFSVTYKSNDAIMCQLYRNAELSLNEINDIRKDARTVTYTQRRSDHSVTLEMKRLNNENFLNLIQDVSVQIIF